MVYAVHVSDYRTGLEKIVAVDAPSPEAAYRRIEKTGCRIERVALAQSDIPAGSVMNPPAPAAPCSEPRESPDEIGRRRLDDRARERAEMVRRHNLEALWPFLAGIGSILFALFQWHNGDDRTAVLTAVLGVILSAIGALRRWTRDQGPWRWSPLSRQCEGTGGPCIRQPVSA